MPASHVPVSTSARADLGLLLVRGAVGVSFLMHGAQKVFERGIAGVTEGFAGMGLPMAGVIAPLVSLGEFLGGIALLAGFLTRVAGAGLTLIMLGAMGLVHLKNGFFGSSGGIELVLLLGAGAAGIALTGPGRYSVDAWRARHRG